MNTETNDSSQFGETLNQINLAEAVRAGTPGAIHVYGDLSTLRRKSAINFLTGDEKPIDDTCDDLVDLWSIEAGKCLRRQNPAVSENIDTYLNFACRAGEPSSTRAFADWLHRIARYALWEASLEPQDGAAPSSSQQAGSTPGCLAEDASREEQNH